MENSSDAYYRIEPCASMAEFAEKIENRFAGNTAFIDGDIIIKYSEFCKNIRKCAAYFGRYSRQYFYIDISSAYYFAIAYLSVVCSDNIAVLSKLPVRSDPSGETAVTEVSEKLIRELINHECPLKTYKRTDPLQPATIAQSSGTTSVAKGVVHSQKALLSNMRAGMTAIKFEENFRYLHVIPYYHLFGLVSNMLAPLYAGAAICDSRTPLNVYSDFLRYHISSTCLPPVLLTGLWNMISRYGLMKTTGGYLKKIICAGAPPDFSIYEGFENNGIQVFTGYGLTECAPCVSVNGDYANKTGSCGKPVICNKVRIIDGEIAVKGDNLMLGYWESPEQTAEVFTDGWLLTGDLGYIDEDGFLFITGRKNNLIVFENGEKLVPEKLETMITSIAEIHECKVSEFQSVNRILLNITVVSTEEKQIVEDQIRQILSDINMLNRLNKITVSETPLERTALGKIKRK